MNIRIKLTLLLAGLAIIIIITGGAFSLYNLNRYFVARAEAGLRNRAAQISYLLAHLPNDSSSTTLAKNFISQSGVAAAAFDSSGNVIFSTGAISGASIPSAAIPPASERVHSDGGTLTLVRHADVSPIANCVAPGAAWIAVEMPLSDLNLTLSAIRTKAMFASLALIVFVIIAVGLVSKKLTAPITEMADTARQIQGGALDQRIPVRGSDEFAQLASTLNAMVDRLNQDIGKLQKLEQIRSQFLGNVSHELRTPLFSLQGMLETLLAGAVDDKEVSHDFVARALANTMRLDALLRDLIEISRIESGEMKMSFRYFTLNAFLAEIVEELAPLAEQKDLALRFSPDAGEVEVYGDRLWLKQAIVNILENALKYTPAGSVTLSTALTPPMYSQKAVTIAITDTGIGIPPEHLPRIFERFYRIDAERSRDAGGTGLGLAIVKHIIEAHGSSVEVSSALGTGTTFSFRLNC